MTCHPDRTVLFPFTPRSNSRCASRFHEPDSRASATASRFGATARRRNEFAVAPGRRAGHEGFRNRQVQQARVRARRSDRQTPSGGRQRGATEVHRQAPRFQAGAQRRRRRRRVRVLSRPGQVHRVRRFPLGLRDRSKPETRRGRVGLRQLDPRRDTQSRVARRVDADQLLGHRFDRARQPQTGTVGLQGRDWTGVR